jgi:hypothetical protein
MSTTNARNSWGVLDHALASHTWNWQPTTTTTEILTEIATFADQTLHLTPDT